MKYYIICLLKGRVVSIHSFDNTPARDNIYQALSKSSYGSEYDELQILDEVY